jgi:hypothetical protein
MQWSSSYYVAHALIMAIGFALGFSAPGWLSPAHCIYTPQAGAPDAGYGLRAKLHWRPQSNDVDGGIISYQVNALRLLRQSR